MRRGPAFRAWVKRAGTLAALLAYLLAGWWYKAMPVMACQFIASASDMLILCAPLDEGTEPVVLEWSRTLRA